MARRFWTQAELDRVRTYYAERVGRPLLLYQLASELNRSRVSIVLKAGRTGCAVDPTRKKVDVLKRRCRYDTPEQLRSAQSEHAKSLIATRGHPRGMLGKTHTAEARRIMGERSRAAWARPDSSFNSEAARQRRSDHMLKRILSGEMRSGYTRSSGGGRRGDLDGIYFRSRWEANYCRYLRMLQSHGTILSWFYECHTFVFEKIKQGTRAYTPDFKVTYPGGRHEWHEVKGWMDGPSKTRLARMARYFPAERVVVIDKTWFARAQRSGLAGVIPGWERGPKPTFTPGVVRRS